MKNTSMDLKSNKGFTLQDVVLATIILILFAGTIATSFLTIYRIQAETKVTAVAGLYGIQIMENIDKIRYDQVTTGIEENYRSLYQIPDSIDIHLDVTPYNSENTIKQIKLTLSYSLEGEKEELVLEKLKVKEV